MRFTGASGSTWARKRSFFLIRFAAVRNVGEIPHKPTLVRAAHARSSACFCAYLKQANMRFSGGPRQQRRRRRVRTPVRNSPDFAAASPSPVDPSAHTRFFAEV